MLSACPVLLALPTTAAAGSGKEALLKKVRAENAVRYSGANTAQLAQRVQQLVGMPSGMPSAAKLSPAAAWRALGPAPIHYVTPDASHPMAGEITGIAIDPRGTTDSVIYVATGLGGVWKTIDGGINWRPLTDDKPSLVMGAVAVDPGNPDVVFAGTGNPYQMAGPIAIGGIGIYKSTDGGATWSIKGGSFLTGVNVYRIHVSQTLRGLVLVATSAGVFRSFDGGESFGADPAARDGRPVLAGDATDIEQDPRQSWVYHAAITNQGIFKSTNMGMSFPTNTLSLEQRAVFGGAKLSASQGKLYAATWAPNNSFAGILRSDNGAASWERRFAGPVGSQPGNTVRESIGFGADPTDGERLYLGTIPLYVSADGGATFFAIDAPSTHADYHTIAFSPPRHIAPRRGASSQAATGASSPACGRHFRAALWSSLRSTSSSGAA